MNANIVLKNGAVLPKKSTPGAAAYDLYAPADFLVKTGRNVMRLEYHMSIPAGYEAHIQSRSGFAAKGMEGYRNLGDENPERFDCDVLEGKGDSDYRGVYGVILKNYDVPFYIKKGTRLAQLTFRKVEDVEFVVVDSLDATERGNGGFGSTGTK